MVVACHCGGMAWDPNVLQDGLLVLCEEMMSFTSCLQNWLIGIELEDTPDCFRVGDAAPMAYIEFIDRENELRQSKPPTPQPPQRAPLDPWTRSRLSRQFAAPKQEKSGSDL